MIEVLFGDSEAGAMKAALRSGKLGSDAVCLGFALDIGDIRKPVTGEYRAKLLCNLLYQEQWGADIEMKNELERLGSVYRSELARLLKHVKSGESVRMWTSKCSYSMCGELWLSELLLHYGCEVYYVELPGFISDDGFAIEYTSWGECEPGAFLDSIHLQKILPREVLVNNVCEWKKLVNENSMLRAVITDRVVSVSTSFYDFLIWKYLGNKPINEAVLIGKILGENPLGIGDYWYARRIDKFITEKRIKIVENSPRKYERVLARNEPEKTPAKSRSNRAIFRNA